MSTKLHDLPTAAVLAATVVPKVVSDDETGSAVDLLQADGPGFAVLAVGAIDAGSVVDATVQESATGSGGWTDIDGAAFATVEAANVTQSLRFTRTMRYARVAIALSGTTPEAAVCALIGSQKKTV